MARTEQQPSPSFGHQNPSNPLEGAAQQITGAVQQLGGAAQQLVQSVGGLFSHPAAPDARLGSPNSQSSPMIFVSMEIRGGVQIKVDDPVSARQHTVVETLSNVPGYYNPELAGGKATGQIITKNGREVFHISELKNVYRQVVPLGPYGLDMNIGQYWPQ
jgi:hypothetical protein